QVQEGVEDLDLMVWPVCPEGVHRLVVTLDHEDPQEVGEPTVLAALGIEEDLHRLPGQLGRAMDVNLLLADGEGLQRTVANLARPLYPFALLPRAKGAG